MILDALGPTPTQTATIWATVIFAVFLGLTYKPAWLSRALFLGVLLLVTFVTIHFSTRYQNIVILKDVSAQVLGYAFFLLWLAHILYKGRFRIADSPLNKPVIGFFLLTVASAYFTPIRFWYYALEEISRFAGVIILFFVLITFCNTRFRWNMALYTFLGLTLVTSVYGYLQFNGYDWMNWGQRVNVSTFGNKDFFASFLTYGTPIALFMMIGAKNWFDRVMYLMIVAAAMYNILTGHTRGAWVGIMFLMVLTVLYEMFFHGRLRQLIGDWRRQIAAWLILAALATASFPLWPSQYQHTFTSIFQAREGTNLIRVYMWWGATRMTLDQPLIGQGVGTFQLAFPYYRPDRYHRIGMSHNTRYAHSEQLNFLAEQGLIGFSAWMAFLAVVFWTGYKRLRKVDDMFERYLLYGILSAFFAGIVHDSMNVNLRWMSSTVAFWFVLALATRYIIGFDARPFQSMEAKSDHPRGGFLAQAAIYLISITAFAFAFWGQYRVLRADYYLNSAQYLVDIADRREEGIKQGKWVLEENPYDHSAFYKLAYAHLNKHDNASAEQYYQNLLGIAPNYAQTHQNTGLIHYERYVNSGNIADMWPAALEFEWSTILENERVNHVKLYRIYHAAKRYQWAQYHNRFVVRVVLEDQNMFSRYFYSRVLDPTKPEEQFKDNRHYYMGTYTDSYREFYYAAIELASQLGLETERRIYFTRSAAERFPNDPMLVNAALQELAVQRPDNPYSQLQLADMIERRLMRGMQTGPETRVAFEQFRTSILQQITARGEDPLRLWLLGLAELELGNTEQAWTALNHAAASSQAKYPFISKRVEQLKIRVADNQA